MVHLWYKVPSPTILFHHSLSCKESKISQGYFPSKAAFSRGDHRYRCSSVTASLKHVGNFFSPTTAPSRMSNGDDHCLISSFSVSTHCLIAYTESSYHGTSCSREGSTEACWPAQLATAEGNSTRKHWSLSISWVLLHVVYVWLQSCCYLVSLLLNLTPLTSLTSIF